jgi:hypothetical protein
MSEKGPKNVEAVIVLGLCEVAQIEAQMFGFVQKLNRRTTVEFTTKPAISANMVLKAGFILGYILHLPSQQNLKILMVFVQPAF